MPGVAAEGEWRGPERAATGAGRGEGIREVKIAEGAGLMRIPITVRIGVTGHRTLGNASVIRDNVRAAMSRLDEMLKNTPHRYVAVSPLAEGADRLVAEEVLAWRGTASEAATLEAPLPLPKKEYEKDFQTEESRAEFEKFLEKAGRQVELETDAAKFTIEPGDTEETKARKKKNRSQAYRRVGLWVTDNCDVLIAVWDGDAARGIGGTAEIVGYARKAQRSLEWIDAGTGELREEKIEKRLLKAFTHHETYNEEKVDEGEIASDSARRFEELTELAEAAGLNPNILGPLRETIVPQYVRATTLAARYKKRYSATGTWMYVLAATSVATVTLVAMFLEGVKLPLGIRGERLIWLEVLQIAGIVGLLIVAAVKDWHRRWIDYRFLAERLRAATYLWVASIPCEPPVALGHQRVSDEWTAGAFRQICSACATQSQLPGPLDAVKKFILEAWIEDQLKFYEKKSGWLERRNFRLEMAGYAAFFLTAGAAVWHAWRGGNPMVDTVRWLPRLLTTLAIILPAAGAALAGIRTYGEYLRNSRRYEAMAQYLAGVAAKIRTEPDEKWLKHTLVEANEVMMREHYDWRVVMLPGISL